MVTDNDACSNCGFPNSSTVRRPQSHANSTVVSSYLRNNLPPSEFEASNIREALADAVGGLVALDGRIEGIEAVLLRLKTERGNLEKVVTDHQAVMSPIRRLSTELVSEIFLYACNSPVTLDTRTGPWPIAQVCDRWRSIAVSTSKLWSSIHINVANQRIPPLSLSILHAIMCRTGNSLLDVAFDVSNPLPVLVSKAGPLLEILAAVSHRWRSIRFTSVQAYIGYLDQIAGHLPSLEEVMITVFDSPLGGGKREFTMFSGAPKLRRLHLGKARGPELHFLGANSFIWTLEPLVRIKCSSYKGPTISRNSSFTDLTKSVPKSLVPTSYGSNISASWSSPKAVKCCTILPSRLSTACISRERLAAPSWQTCRCSLIERHILSPS